MKLLLAIALVLVSMPLRSDCLWYYEEKREEYANTCWRVIQNTKEQRQSLSDDYRRCFHVKVVRLEGELAAQGCLDFLKSVNRNREFTYE